MDKHNIFTFDSYFSIHRSQLDNISSHFPSRSRAFFPFRIGSLDNKKRGRERDDDKTEVAPLTKHGGYLLCPISYNIKLKSDFIR